MPGVTHRTPHEDTERVGAFFDEQWTVYQKFLQHDYLEHRLFYALLHAVLLTRFDGAVRMLELGCGDASQTARTFTEVALARYVGVDLSTVALELARTNLAGRCADVALVPRDMLRGLREVGESFDVVLSSFALHHLHEEEKREALALVDRVLRPHGVFVLIDVMRRSDESRDAYLARCVGYYRTQCPAFTARDLDLIEAHVTAADFPETAKTLRRLGAAAGFSRVAQLATGAEELAAALCFFR